ncbi:MAG: HlyD family efflux transporter periplasmic adaptor subunit, partial [Planctomycetota bacterium]
MNVLCTANALLVSVVNPKRITTRVAICVLTIALWGFSPVTVKAQYFQSLKNDPVIASPVKLDYEGFTEPKFDLMVAATEIGRVTEVTVQVGDVVRQGQTVARLEDGLQREALATASWQAQMRGESDAATAELKLATLRLEQLQRLADRNMARPDEVKRANADWEVAKSRELAAREEDKLRELEFSRYQLQLERRRVKAPMAGVVADVFHHPGEYVTPGDPAVIRLLVIDELYAVFNIPAEDKPLFNRAGVVNVTLLNAKRSVPGKIAS